MLKNVYSGPGTTRSVIAVDCRHAEWIVTYASSLLQRPCEQTFGAGSRINGRPRGSLMADVDRMSLHNIYGVHTRVRVLLCSTHAC